MSNGFKPGQFFWRASAAVLRRTSAALNKASAVAYSQTLPKLTAEERQLIKNNRSLHRRHAGRRCFVIGNGPSLRNQDLSLLSNEITFVMNAFWKHPIVEQWQPTYYLLSDPILFERSEPIRNFFASLRARIHNTTFIVPITGRSAIVDEGFLPMESTRFVAFHKQERTPVVEQDIDFTRLLSGVSTIAQLALMAAMYTGCSPIYLMGLDHNWLADRHGGDLNFYPGKTLENHPFVTGRSMYSYDADMEAMLAAWKCYRALDNIAGQMGCKIINATDGGYLDVFERAPYHSLFHQPLLVRT